MMRVDVTSWRMGAMIVGMGMHTNHTPKALHQLHRLGGTVLRQAFPAARHNTCQYESVVVAPPKARDPHRPTTNNSHALCVS